MGCSVSQSWYVSLFTCQLLVATLTATNNDAVVTNDSTAAT